MIDVKWSCSECGALGVVLPVRLRRSGEPIQDWVREINLWIAKAHRDRSKTCSKKLTSVECPRHPLDTEEMGMRSCRWIGGQLFWGPDDGSEPSIPDEEVDPSEEQLADAEASGEDQR